MLFEQFNELALILLVAWQADLIDQIAALLPCVVDVRGFERRRVAALAQSSSSDF